MRNSQNGASNRIGELLLGGRSFAGQTQEWIDVLGNKSNRNRNGCRTGISMNALASIIAVLTFYMPVIAADNQIAPPDNTQKNERDRSGDTRTPMDQGNSPEDLKLTQAIRRAVVKDDALTMTAKNIKIITAGGAVTLRGPVNTVEEKTKIEELAKAAAGGAKVDNQLEVKAEPSK